MQQLFALFELQFHIHQCNYISHHNHELNQQLELYSQGIDADIYSFLYMYLCCYRVYLMFRLYYVGKVFLCLQRGFSG